MATFAITVQQTVQQTVVVYVTAADKDTAHDKAIELAKGMDFTTHGQHVNTDYDVLAIWQA